MAKITDNPLKSMVAAQTLPIVQEYQFMGWVSQLDTIINKLTMEYDMFYRQTFEVKLYEFLTTGKNYVDIILSRLNPEISPFPDVTGAKIRQYTIIKIGIIDMINVFTDDEFYYLAYRRHGACHIFQTGYDILQFKDGVLQEKIKTEIGLTKKDGTKENISLDYIDKCQKEIILTYGEGDPKKGDENFGMSVFNKTQQIFKKMYNQINEIRP